MADEVARWPGVTHRTTIIGKTGSGKTQCGAFILSRSPFDVQPYVIVDYKRDDLLQSIDRIKEIGLNDRFPKHPGLYCVKPMPGDDDAVEKWLWRVWEHERIGLFFDEGTLVPGNVAGARGGAFQALLTQGRSKRCPCITVTQRPAGISKFCFSEADFVALFYLNTDTDLKRVREFLPKEAIEGLLQDYHWRWYDGARNKLTFYSPVPDADTIRNQISDRLAPKRRLI